MPVGIDLSEFLSEDYVLAENITNSRQLAQGYVLAFYGEFVFADSPKLDSFEQSLIRFIQRFGFVPTRKELDGYTFFRRLPNRKA